MVPLFFLGICSLFSELYIETNLPATFESLDTFNIWKNKKCPRFSFKCLRGTQEGLKAILYQRIVGPVWLLFVSTSRSKKEEKNYDPKDLFERTWIPFCSIFYVRISIGLKDLEKALVICSSFEVRRERWNFRFSKIEK